MLLAHFVTQQLVRDVSKLHSLLHCLHSVYLLPIGCHVRYVCCDPHSGATVLSCHTLSPIHWCYNSQDTKKEIVQILLSSTLGTYPRRHGTCLRWRCNYEWLQVLMKQWLFLFRGQMTGTSGCKAESVATEDVHEGWHHYSILCEETTNAYRQMLLEMLENNKDQVKVARCNRTTVNQKKLN